MGRQCLRRDNGHSASVMGKQANTCRDGITSGLHVLQLREI